MFAAFIAQHHLPFSIANHFSQLVPVMFPDSHIAKQYGSARTKTTMMIRGKLCKISVAEILK